MRKLLLALCAVALLGAADPEPPTPVPLPPPPKIERVPAPDFEQKLDLEAQITRAQCGKMFGVLQQRATQYPEPRERMMIFTIQIAQIIATMVQIYMGLPENQQRYIDQLVPMLIAEMAERQKSQL